MAATIQNSNSLPDDVIISILVLLPLKSLLRFKCLSKHWHTLISTPDLAILHRNRVPDRTKFSYFFSYRYEQSRSLFYFDIAEDPPIHLIPSPSIFNHLFVVGSINGLVCFRCRRSRIITLLNPALNQKKRIRVSSLEFGGNPKKISFGFGYDPVKDDYKVIRIICLEGSRVLAEVYSTNLDYWKEVQFNFSFTLDKLKPENTSILNRMPYWTVKNESSFDIIWFDVCNDVFERVTWPRYGDRWDHRKLVEWKGSIALLVCFWGEFKYKGCLDILVYDENGASWKKKGTFGPMGLAGSDFFGKMFIVNCTRDGVIFAATNWELCVHDPVTNEFRMFSYSKGRRFFSEAFEYKESLVCLKGMEYREYIH